MRRGKKMKKCANRTLLGASFLAISLVATGQHAAAQEVSEDVDTVGDGATRNEIVVTAQRRAQSIQDVGIAITAVSADTMREMGIVDSTDISRVAPGVILDSTASGGVNANLTVRGISQSDFSSNQESPNSIYIDDVYLSSANAAAFTLYDLERVEVLRGPQGTLFGRASSGGLVNFIVAKPTDYLSGYVEAGYGNFDAMYVEGALSGPISDNVRVRVSGRREVADGWYENGLAGGEDAFEKDFYGVRFQLEADVTPDLTARLSVSYDANPLHNEGTYRTVNAYFDGVSAQPVELPADVDAYGTGPGNDFAGYRNPYTKFNKADFNNDVGFLKNHRFSPTLNLEWQLGGSTLTSITNYTEFGYEYGEDDDGGPLDFFRSEISQDLDQWSQELRINGDSGPLTYTAGFYYLNTDQTYPSLLVFPALAGTEFGFRVTNETRQQVNSWALFGQVEYELTDTLSATVGLRYTDEHKEFSSQVFFQELGTAYGGPGVLEPPLLIYDFSEAAVGDLAVQNEGLWSGKIQLDYKPNEDMLFYAGVSRGVKAAGFNTNLDGSTGIDDTPFGSENVYAYEVGSKLDLLDRRLRINTSAFYYDYSDFQGFSYNGISAVIRNYDGYFAGGEVEIYAAPSDDIDISFSAAYLDSKLYDVQTVYSGVIDQESIRAPKWTLNGSVTKRFELSFGTLAVSWNGNYIDDRYASIENTAATFIPGSFMHNARLTLSLPKPDLELAFFVDNISNVARLQHASDLTLTTGSWLRSYAPPRMYGASIRKSF